MFSTSRKEAVSELFNLLLQSISQPLLGQTVVSKQQANLQGYKNFAAVKRILQEKPFNVQMSGEDFDAYEDIFMQKFKDSVGLLRSDPGIEVETMDLEEFLHEKKDLLRHSPFSRAEFRAYKLRLRDRLVVKKERMDWSSRLKALWGVVVGIATIVVGTLLSTVAPNVGAALVANGVSDIAFSVRIVKHSLKFPFC